MTGKFGLTLAILLVLSAVLMAGCTGSTETTSGVGDATSTPVTGTATNTSMPIMPGGNVSLPAGGFNNSTMVPPDGNRTPPGGFGNGTMPDMGGKNGTMPFPGNVNMTPPGGFGNQTMPAPTS